MTDEGRPRSEIQQKLFSFIDKMPAKEEKDKAKEETVKVKWRAKFWNRG